VPGVMHANSSLGERVNASPTEEKLALLVFADTVCAWAA
jgi:hypothetical protein